MKWSDKIEEWANGIPQSYPTRIKDGFFYETSRIDNHMSNKYKERYIVSKKLNFPQDSTQFNTHIQKSNNKYFVSFWNLSKDSFLLCPMPRRGKDFSTIKTFIDNASQIQQKYFWIEAARLVKKLLKTHEHIYVNTHGSGVPYFHLRFDTIPKYLQTKEFI